VCHGRIAFFNWLGLSAAIRSNRESSSRPSFNALQNYGSAPANRVSYLFDVSILGGRNLRGETPDLRRKMLEDKVLPRLAEPIRAPTVLLGRLGDLIRGV